MFHWKLTSSTMIGLPLLLVTLGSTSCAGSSPEPKAAVSEEPAAKAAAPTDSGPVPEAGIPLVKLPPREVRPEVPGFRAATGWLNVDRPLELSDLKGRVVVVDFWTSCCINCMHTLATLHRLEERFAGAPVVVVGVHSAKFVDESDVERLRDAVRSLGQKHPVAVDGEMGIWQAWDAQSWPTIFVLDANGRVILADTGEPDERVLTSVVASALAEARERGELAKGPLAGLKPEPAAGGALRYPAKLTLFGKDQLAVTDAGNHRVVLLKAGEDPVVIGAGQPGLVDGNFEQARFNWPQGIAELDGALYVADTNNHVIRRIDRTARTVTTVAGTGELGRRYVFPEPEPALEAPLRSPWGLLPWQHRLWVTLAGSHQIAIFDPKKQTMQLFAGSGREDIVDGDRLEAAFAQPSDLATDGRELFVLDSETSSVRAVGLTQGKVRTLVGQGLFVFGDVDGARDVARLQHPIGMSYGAGALWVGDSYNSKIKRVDPKTGNVTTVFGQGGKGDALSEPAGIAWTKQGLLVADTNHHRIARLILAGTTATFVDAVALGTLTAPSFRAAPVVINLEDPSVDFGELTLASGKPASLQVKFDLPQGTKINAEGPARMTWVVAEGFAALPSPLRAKGADVADGFEVKLEPAPGAAGGHLSGVLELVVCDESNTLCVQVRRTVVSSVHFDPAAKAEATARVALPEAR